MHSYVVGDGLHELSVFGGEIHRGDGLGVVLDGDLDGELFLSPGIPRCTVSGAGWRLAWWPSSLPCV